MKKLTKPRTKGLNRLASSLGRNNEWTKETNKLKETNSI